MRRWTSWTAWTAATLAWISSIFYALFDFFSDLYNFWHPRFISYIFRPSARQQLFQRLKNAKSFEEWNSIAFEIDEYNGNDVWRTNSADKNYDYKFIASMKLKLDLLRSDGRYPELVDVLYSLLFRNLGSISTSALFTRAYSGTKILIEDYIESVLQALEELRKVHSIDLRTFFRNSRQSFGRTALVLRGDPLFGMCHLGVVKSLRTNDLLPTVITGAAMSSIVAAYVCSVPDSELLEAIDSLPKSIRSAVSPDHSGNAQDSIGSAVEGAYRSLYTHEALTFFEYVNTQLGDMTFEESYALCGRVLNILVLPENAKSGTFFNYLSAPKVLIRSAILASIGTGVLPYHHDVDLLVKDYDGSIKEQGEKSLKRFWPANQKSYVPPRESPYTRLAEMFNVNNYVVSVSRPYFAPFLLSEFRYRGRPRLWQRVITLFRISVQYRVAQLADLGLLSQQFKSMLIDEIIPCKMQVNIVPEANSLLRDLLLVYDSTSISQKIHHWIQWGERSTWPHMSCIWVRSRLEYALLEFQESVENCV